MRSIIIFLNRTCPVGCATCNVNASVDNTEFLDPEWIARFFINIDRFRSKQYIVWTGGEPFLSFDSLKIGLKLAAAYGFKSEILSSGVWVQQHPEFLRDLKKSGNYNLRLSLDAEHQKTVPWEYVRKTVRESSKLGIELNFTLRHIPNEHEFTPEFYINRIKTEFPELYHLNRDNHRWIHVINTFGKDTQLSDINRKLKQRCYLGFKDVVVGFDGYVYPCCGLLGGPAKRCYRLGDALITGYDEIWHAIRKHPVLSLIRSKGPAAALSRFDASFDHNTSVEHMEPCDICQIYIQHLKEFGFSERYS
ncbi:radical SAM protein [bacterium]|nr:radical SAM protein [candidate division CSSED10-310 bacterium]